MKKTIISLSAVIGLVLVWASLLHASPVTLTWDYDFTVDPACSTANPTDCLKEFCVMDSDSGETIATVPAPQTTATIDLKKPYGLRHFCVCAVSDIGIKSDPSNIIEVQVRPGNPRNLR